MAHRYLMAPLPEPGIRVLSGEVAHHLGRVLRAAPGDTITLFDGSGRECPARVRHVRHVRHDRAGGRRPDTGIQVEVEVGPAAASAREPHVALELAVALPKGARADWLFEHGTELGVRAFRPILTARSRILSTADALAVAERTARWRRIVAAAAGQCDRALVPDVHEPLPLAALLAATASLPAERYLADPSGERLGRARTSHCLFAVGPEGGFTPEEVATLQAHAFALRGLGPLVLRVETAALAGAVRLLA